MIGSAETVSGPVNFYQLPLLLPPSPEVCFWNLAMQLLIFCDESPLV
jgi:hypothetical protein